MSSDLNAGPSAGQVAVVRGRGVYFVATLVSQASALLRYVVMARLLGPEQLGLAATLVLTGSFFDLISDTGADRFLVQDRHGDSTQLQGVVQMVLVVRGALSALALAAFAMPISQFYGAPRLAGGLAVLAISPLVMGFLHLDVRRRQRFHDFRSQAACMILAEVVGLVATVAAAWLRRDFTAILYGLIARSVVMVAVSHLLAERPYGVRWNGEHGPRLVRFGAPLMANGVILFLVSQGDRVIIGKQIGVSALGVYSAIMLLIYYPTALLGSYINNLYIPLIASLRDSVEERNRKIEVLSGQYFVLAAAMAAGFAVVAPVLTPLLFGARFAQGALLVGLIGILQLTRFMFGVPATAALALGRSGTVLASNLLHLIAFAGGLAGLADGLRGVINGFVGGEMIALCIARSLLNRDMRVSLWRGFDRLAAFGAICGAIVAFDVAMQGRSLPAELLVGMFSALLAGWILRREAGVIRSLLVSVQSVASPLLRRLASR